MTPEAMVALGIAVNGALLTWIGVLHTRKDKREEKRLQEAKEDREDRKEAINHVKEFYLAARQEIIENREEIKGLHVEVLELKDRLRQAEEREKRDEIEITRLRHQIRDLEQEIQSYKDAGFLGPISDEKPEGLSD